MTPRNHLSFRVNGAVHFAALPGATQTLAQFLRETLRLTGTKIACNEGDCGSCTVLLGVPANGSYQYRAINACITPLFQCDSAHVVTIEGATAEGRNCIPNALAAAHAIQCGFCTPGFVMSLSAPQPNLAGNLCRCTGYLPILEANSSSNLPLFPQLPVPAIESVLLENEGSTLFIPATLSEALAHLRRYPRATMIAGATDLTPHRILNGDLLALSRIPELLEIAGTPTEISIGAAVTLDTLSQQFPGLDLFGSPQVRAAATLGGNIANGSPIADSLPMLLAASARIEVVSPAGSRVIPLEEFIPAPGQIILRVILPRPAPEVLWCLYKFSMRRHIDAGAITAAIAVTQSGGLITASRVVIGGAGPATVRLPQIEALLAGQPFSLATFTSAGLAAAAALTPRSDHRGTAQYRRLLVANLFPKFFHDVTTPSLSTALSAPVAPKPTGAVHHHALAHATGRSQFLADLPPLSSELALAFVSTSIPKGRILSVDRSALPPGVFLFTADDVPGKLHFGSIQADEAFLAQTQLTYAFQPIAIVAADSPARAAGAAGLVRLDVAPETPVLSISEAIAQGRFFETGKRIESGNFPAAWEAAPHRLEGALTIGGQEHAYLETQSALAIPDPLGGITLKCSTQNPSEVQSAVAAMLGLGMHQVIVEATLMGGAFGGKETQATLPALACALAAHRTGRPARLVLSRRDDMRLTGKRHDYSIRWRAAYSDNGAIDALEMNLFSNGGAALDLSSAVMERSLLHATNAYFVPNVRLVGRVCRTNLPPNTAFRGFGAPQAVAAMEHVIESVAAALGLDPLHVRSQNIFQPPVRNVTPYGQTIPAVALTKLLRHVDTETGYTRRRAALTESPAVVRGISLVPIHFGISFTKPALNQANALVHLFPDATVQVSTGATDMGQGTTTRIRQIVAEEFGILHEHVRVLPTSTDKNHNTAPTAASVSTDLNGMAARDAVRQIRGRLAPFAHLPFPEQVRAAYAARVDLGARGFFATSGIHFDWATGRGEPFRYFASGAAVTEVSVCRFTGVTRVEQVQLFMDTGNALNPALDRGQLLGGFVQGMGWILSEQLTHENGVLRTDSFASYKIPTLADIPDRFSTEFLNNPDPAVLTGGKGIGEPPLLLAISIWTAIRHALSFLKPGAKIQLNLPATPEQVLLEIDRLQRS